MFNIGGAELLVIFVVALIVLGPQRLPDAARQMGRWVGELRRLSSGFQAELRDALDEPFDTTEPDPGWNHRRRGTTARQAQLRPSVSHDRAPVRPVDAGEATAPVAEPPETAAAGADGALPASEADPTASTGPVGLAPDAPDPDADAPAADARPTGTGGSGGDPGAHPTGTGGPGGDPHA